MWLSASVLALSMAAVTPAAAGADHPELAEMAARVSPAQMQATIAQLVAFGTRHTLSDTASETRGIGTARRWTRPGLRPSAKIAAAVWRSSPRKTR